MTELERVAPPALAALSIVAALFAFVVVSGCSPTLTPLQRRLAIIETTALTVGSASEAIHLASGVQADTDCVPLGPSGSPERGACLDLLLERWRGADTAVNGAALALGAWLAAELAGHGDTGAAMAEALRLVAELPRALAPYGVTLGGGQ